MTESTNSTNILSEAALSIKNQDCDFSDANNVSTGTDIYSHSGIKAKIMKPLCDLAKSSPE